MGTASSHQSLVSQATSGLGPRLLNWHFNFMLSLPAGSSKANDDLQFGGGKQGCEPVQPLCFKEIVDQDGGVEVGG